MALTTIPAAGAKLRGSVLNSLITEVRGLLARKTSDETVNNSATLQNDNELLLAVEANAVYHFGGRLAFTTGTTPDLKFAWTFPAGLTMAYNVSVFAVGTSVLDQFAFDQTLTANCEGHASLTRTAMLDGIVVVSSTAGTLQLQWAQIAATASDTIMKSGSSIWLTRVS